MALHTEEVLQLADHPFYDLTLAGRPTTIGLRPRPPGVVVGGCGHQSPVFLQPAPLPLHPRKPFVCQTPSWPATVTKRIWQTKGLRGWSGSGAGWRSTGLWWPPPRTTTPAGRGRRPIVVGRPASARS